MKHSFRRVPSRRFQRRRPPRNKFFEACPRSLVCAIRNPPPIFLEEGRALSAPDRLSLRRTFRERIRGNLSFDKSRLRFRRFSNIGLQNLKREPVWSLRNQDSQLKSSLSRRSCNGQWGQHPKSLCSNEVETETRTQARAIRILR
jgi:hypothetical protein